ncbi:lipase family protein [Paenibacillus kobensis]|uniref:lipase family protein n=1 Tax=Paenibacillus kobensis TaxID=59841 RepID=UPI000FD7ABCA|nr:lipase family protein [Paenibacillus kobensis]
MAWRTEVDEKGVFDTRTALFMAAICEQSYVQYYNPAGMFLMPNGYRTVGSFKAQAYDSEPAFFGFLIESDRAAILAFRGTRSTMDWVSDFISQQILFKPVKPRCLCHKGFTDIYTSCQEEVRSLIKASDPDKQLFVTGHSLGGALATLAAFDIALNVKREPIVYTFGSPRVGDPKFARTYNRIVKHHWRVQNEYDIVSHLPPVVYRQPKTKNIFYYMHVRGEVKRSFRMGTVSGNHVLRSYFADLAKDDPSYAAALCASPMGWCPSPPDPPPADE